MPTTRARPGPTTGFPRVRRGGLGVAVGCAINLLPLLPSGTAAQPATAGCEAPEHRQFDFWIGEWDVRNRQLDPARPGDTTLHETGVATNRVYAVLDGCAIVEHWEGHLLPDRHVLGFSVRAWDPARGTWVALLNWPGPRGPAFFTLEGTFEDGVGTFSFDAPAGGRVRYRFEDIRPDGLRWAASRRGPGEENWTTFWIMEFERRDPRREPALLNGPARTTDRCPGERARDYDFLVGDWVGEEVGPEGGGARPVEVRAWPILEGCAVMEFVRLGTGPERERRFRVRSFVPGEERWVQYTVRQRSPALVRWEGHEGEDGRELLRAEPPEADERQRTRYRVLGPDAFVRELEVRREDGGWETVARTRLRRR